MKNGKSGVREKKVRLLQNYEGTLSRAAIAHINTPSKKVVVVGNEEREEDEDTQ